MHIVIFFIIGISLVLYFNRKEQQRLDCLPKLADSLGFEFIGKPKGSTPWAPYKALPLFQRKGTIDNELSKETDTGTLKILDYSYRTSSSDNHSRCTRQYVVLFKSNTLSWGGFRIYPQSITDKVIHMLGLRRKTDWNSDTHKLVCNSKKTRSKVISSHLFRYLHDNPKVCIEGSYNLFICYLPNKVPDDETFEEFIQNSIQLIKMVGTTEQ